MQSISMILNFVLVNTFINIFYFPTLSLKKYLFFQYMYYIIAYYKYLMNEDVLHFKSKEKRSAKHFKIFKSRDSHKLSTNPIFSSLHQVIY